MYTALQILAEGSSLVAKPQIARDHRQAGGRLLQQEASEPPQALRTGLCSCQPTLRGAKLGPRNTVVPGDVILSVEGKPVRNAGELNATLDDYRIGQQLKLQIWREGRRIDVAVQLRPGEEG